MQSCRDWNQFKNCGSNYGPISFMLLEFQKRVGLIAGPLSTVATVTGQINCVLWALIIAWVVVVPDWCWIGSIRTYWYKWCGFWQEGREGKKLHSDSGLWGWGVSSIRVKTINGVTDWERASSQITCCCPTVLFCWFYFLVICNIRS